jgi:hypothetical protein
MTSPSAERTGIDGFGIASLVLGIAGLLPIPGLLSSGLALLFGYLSRSHRGNSQPATAGIVLGWIGVISWSDRDIRVFRAPRVSASGDPSLPPVAQCSLIVHMTNQTALRFR